MRADLHVHSYYSDGAYPPRELARRAKAAGLALVSFTDHDSMEGAEEQRSAAEEYGLLSG
ncbi:MAG: PHP domain-containing protein, partial [Clostridia bacterium]|nr:PHP domain-containing protein [Clostridia bacterium]